MSFFWGQDDQDDDSNISLTRHSGAVALLFRLSLGFCFFSLGEQLKASPCTVPLFFLSLDYLNYPTIFCGTIGKRPGDFFSQPCGW